MIIGSTNRLGRMSLYFVLVFCLFQVIPAVMAQDISSDFMPLDIERGQKTPLLVSVTAEQDFLTPQDVLMLDISITNSGNIPLTNVWVQVPSHPAFEYLDFDAQSLRFDVLPTNHTEKVAIQARFLGWHEAEVEWGVVATAVETNNSQTTLTFKTEPQSRSSLALAPPSTPEPWQYTFNPPGGSGFTGAAQYSYGFDIPPGDGGLAPALSLSYSSRSIDSLYAPAMSRGFGSGWSMPQAEIINGNANGMRAGGNFANYNFTLVLNGASYPLLRHGGVNDFDRYGQYIAIGDPKLYIEYVEEDVNSPIPNDSGEYWMVLTSDGTEYRFGYNADSEQIVKVGDGAAADPNRNLTQPRNRSFAPLVGN